VTPQNASHRAVAGGADAGQRLDRFLAQAILPHAPELTRSRVKSLIIAGHARAGGATITEPSHRVKPGLAYELAVPPPEAAVPAGQALPLTVAYEDDDLIVIDKAAGMVVHPAPGNPDRTLVNALIAHCGASLSGIGGVRRPGIVHRLDKGTSGIMVAAKTDAAHAGLSAQFSGHTIERTYVALVWGVPKPAQGTITGAIARHPVQRKKMAVAKSRGKAAATKYRVLQACGPFASLVECRPETGRTHQIRVHLSHIGHPLLGDAVYGGLQRGRMAALPAAVAAAVAGLDRAALHARRLGFRHPRTGERLAFESPLPPDMEAALAALGELADRPRVDLKGAGR
jgi:23S rRNA pseudouridine1911/1915/1917 synthase